MTGTSANAPNAVPPGGFNRPRDQALIEDIAQAVIAIVRDNQHLAVPIAFLVAFGESLCFLSVLWPGTAILAGIAGLFAASGISASVVLPMTIAAALGGTLGYAISYWIGYYFKGSIERVWPFKNNPDLVRKGEYFFHRYGAWSVFLGHFFGPIRAVIPVVAGMFAMRQIPFQIANFASAVLWAGGVVGSAFYVVAYIDQIFEFMRTHEMLVAATLFLIAVVLAIPRSIVFWPALAVFVAIGFAHLYAGGAFLPIWLAATGGAIVGDLAAFAIGTRQRDDLLNLRFLHGQVQAVDSARERVAADGALAILPSKAGSIARSVVPMLAGALKVDRVKFALASIFSSAIWAGVLLSPFPIAQVLGL